MARGVSRPLKRYLEQFRKLQQGHLYRTYKREIVLTPNTAKKIIKVHVVLNIIMVTSYTGKTPNYCYTPRFKNKKDAETLKVSAVNNGKSVACNGGELVKRDDHLTREYKIELDSNCRNSLTITSYYCYSLDDTYTFLKPILPKTQVVNLLVNSKLTVQKQINGILKWIIISTKSAA